MSHSLHYDKEFIFHTSTHLQGCGLNGTPHTVYAATLIPSLLFYFIYLRKSRSCFGNGARLKNNTIK